MTKAQAAAEKILGHAFADRALLDFALTHPSATASAEAGNRFQRLEFLGDRVLGLCVADMLLAAHPTESEGQINKRFAALVRKETCAAVMAESGLDGLLRMTGAAKDNQSVLGDACEALIGALYRDGGLEVARGFIEGNWRERMSKPPAKLGDAKSRLQEWSLARGLGVPDYRVLTRDGPDHAPVFTVEARVADRGAARGSGQSKRDAEMEAAASLLAHVADQP
ncbi:MAG: ribonuclease III [Flavobacteriaceae bacterium]